MGRGRYHRPMRKKILLALAALGLVFFIWLGLRLPTMLLAANGYAAKWTCSNVFVGERTLEQAVGDLPPNPLAKWLSVDLAGDRATARLWGRFTRVAVHRQGFGCTLLPPKADSEALVGVPTLGPTQTAEWLSPGPTVDVPAVEAAIAQAFDEKDPERAKNTRAVVVVWNGALIAERYAADFGPDQRLPGWSMTKSVLNTLYGRAEHLGLLKRDDRPVIEAWQDGRREINFDHLLRMSSGLAFSENYADLGSDAVRMLFVSGDTGGFAAQSPLTSTPDTTWYYSSGTSNLLSRELRRILGTEASLRFAHEQLFAPLGMSSALIEPDASGTFVASSFGWATARDWARFGWFYLEDGVVDGERLLPEGWVDYSRSPTPAAPRGLYGAQFWLNAGSPEDAEDRRWPELPPDLYLASGFDGQAVVIVPSRHAVIVRLGLSQAGSSWSLPDFLLDVLEALPTELPSELPESIQQEASEAFAE